MAHRQTREEERCPKSALLGVHVWEFAKVIHEEAGRPVEIIRCLHCQSEPEAVLAERLYAERAAQVERDGISKRLHESQSKGTGTNLTRRAS